MALRIAVSGLKHAHVLAVLKIALEDPRVGVVAIAEDEEIFRRGVEQAFGVEVRYTSHEQLLESVDFDLLVVCEAFGRRGEVVIDALKQGRHVFSDKPLCTSEQELWKIAALSDEKHKEVGLDLSLRHFWASTGPPLQQGEIGEIVSVAMFGPHYLDYGNRPRWYFQPGMHGGILNDILGHGVDYVHWVTGKRTTQVLSACRACVGLPQEPEFENLGEAHLQLEDGASVYGRVDYLIPAGHSAPWRVFMVGTEGDATVDERGMCLRRSGEAERTFEAGAPQRRWEHPFADFVHLLVEGDQPLRTTEETLQSSLTTLIAQQAADTSNTRVEIPAISRHR
ncbi:MAG: Gfo/Idh/MocA family oxidoreductase [Armatimonadetes bacterium]|nr:Gfo/Idh/MocA family oxidoreductase [Armatimonadota bacterium]